jgi:hypothetical protein
MKELVSAFVKISCAMKKGSKESGLKTRNDARKGFEVKNIRQRMGKFIRKICHMVKKDASKANTVSKHCGSKYFFLLNLDSNLVARS